MSEAVRIRKNSLYSTLSISSRLIANVFVFWIMARYYGPYSFGQFTSAHTLATIFILFADFGFDILLTTEIARNRINAVKLFRQFYSLKLVFSFVTLVVMWLICLFGNFSTDTRMLILILSFYTVFTTLSNFLYALYKGFERLEYETKVSIFVNISLILIALPLIIIKANVLLIGAVFVLTRVIGFAIGIYYSFKLLPSIQFKPLFQDFHEIRNKVFVFGFFLLFNNLFFQLDTILLSLWKGDKEVGVYQAVFKLIMLPLVVPDILINTLLPLLARLNLESQQQWRRVGFIMNKILIAVVLPVSIFLFVFSEQLINIIYGARDYADAVPILKVFAVILFVRFSMEAYALMLTTSHRQQIRLYAVIAATVFNFSLNYFMIPEYGAFGAAIVSLITNIFVGLVYYAVNIDLVRYYLFNVKTISFLFTSLIIAYFFWLNKSITVFIMAPVFGVVFILLVYYFFFSKDEIKLIFSEQFRFSFFKK
jgi:O-antigen/teichoic acid export membrane protein